METIREVLERGLRKLLEPAMDAFTRWGVHPNLLTTLGFLVTCASGFFFHQHHVRTAGFLILLGGSFDMLDGTVARRTGLGSAFGAFYDSTLDRFSEIVVYLGILSLYNDYRLVLGDVGMIYTVLLVMAGSLMISYTRARAESLGVDCDVGLMQRPERVVLIGAAALFFGEHGQGIVLKGVLILLAVLTNYTALQRIYWVWKQTRPAGEGSAAGPAPPDGEVRSEREETSRIGESGGADDDDHH